MSAGVELLLALKRRAVCRYHSRGFPDENRSGARFTKQFVWNLLTILDSRARLFKTNDVVS